MKIRLKSRVVSRVALISRKGEWLGRSEIMPGEMNDAAIIQKVYPISRRVRLLRIEKLALTDFKTDDRKGHVIAPQAVAATHYIVAHASREVARRRKNGEREYAVHPELHGSVHVFD